MDHRARFAAARTRLIEYWGQSWQYCRPESTNNNSTLPSAQFREAVGPEWVFTSEEELHPYRDHFSYIKDQPNELIPSAAVGPNTVEQVQAIVRTANQYKIPLYAISTGKNFAYGGAAPVCYPDRRARPRPDGSSPRGE